MSGILTIVRSLWRGHRLLAVILVMEYALTFAIILSAGAIAQARLQAVGADSGIDGQGLYIVEPNSGTSTVHRGDLQQAMQSFARVVPSDDMALTSAVPFLGRNDARMTIIAAPGDEVEVSVYRGNLSLPRVLGSRIVAGRRFIPGEAPRSAAFADGAHVAILSEPLAERLFHGKPAVGRQVRLASSSYTIVGVCAALAAPQYIGPVATDYTVMLPGGIAGTRLPGIVLVRSPNRAAIERAVHQLNATTAGRIDWSIQSFTEIASDYFRADRMTLMGLLASCAAVLLTSLCGVLGLTRYWILRRKPQVAIRRALGARRWQVLLHFVSESAVLVSTGLVLGTVFALLASRWTGLVGEDGLGRVSLLGAIAVTAGLALASVWLSLQPLLKLPPAELARSL